jgi:hypothetical protein
VAQQRPQVKAVTVEVAQQQILRITVQVAVVVQVQ